MKIAAVVILYNPGEEAISNIQSFLSFVGRVYVFDNSENQKKELKGDITSLPKTIYFNNEENEGIAARLNQACRLALSDGFEWLLTMDQDSYFNEADIDNYLNCILSDKNNNYVAMYGVEYENVSTTETCLPVEVERLITSGSIINLPLFSIIGGFDEALFIDEVDLDYCYNAITHGFKIVQFKNIFLNHTLGKISYHRSLKSLQSTPRTLHSPIRVYYMIRNFLYVNAKYKNDFQLDKKRRKKALRNRVKNNFLYGRKRWLLIRLILEAFKDFKKSKMGKKHLSNI